MMKVSLKAARVNKELKRDVVARKLGCSIDTLKAIESGKREIRVTEMDLLCKIYNCTRDDIFLPYNSTNSEIKKGE